MHCVRCYFFMYSEMCYLGRYSKMCCFMHCDIRCFYVLVCTMRIWRIGSKNVTSLPFNEILRRSRYEARIYVVKEPTMRKLWRKFNAHVLNLTKMPTRDARDKRMSNHNARAKRVWLSSDALNRRMSNHNARRKWMQLLFDARSGRMSNHNARRKRMWLIFDARRDHNACRKQMWLIRDARSGRTGNRYTDGPTKLGVNFPYMRKYLFIMLSAGRWARCYARGRRMG